MTVDSMIDDIKSYLRENLSKYRYDHIIGVRDMAVKLGLIYDLNLNKLEISALLHDSAKDISIEDLVKISRQNNLLNEEDYDYPCILHPVVGVFIAKSKFKIEDEDILNGILYHTTGRANMSLFEKVIFIADKVEEGRDFEGVLKLRSMAFTDMDETILSYFDMELTRLISRGRCIHPKSFECRNFYIISKAKNEG